MKIKGMSQWKRKENHECSTGSYPFYIEQPLHAFIRAESGLEQMRVSPK
jgi:hypothetical protein